VRSDEEVRQILNQGLDRVHTMCATLTVATNSGEQKASGDWCAYVIQVERHRWIEEALSGEPPPSIN
jgi:hypothetical protein